MTLDQQETYLSLIRDDFDMMQKLLSGIHENITQYPVYTQLAFIKPLKSILFEAWADSEDESNDFLNNYNGGDKIEIY